MSTKLIRVDLATYLRYKQVSEEQGRSMASIAERALDAYQTPPLVQHIIEKAAATIPRLTPMQLDRQYPKGKGGLAQPEKSPNPSANPQELTYEPDLE